MLDLEPSTEVELVDILQLVVLHILLPILGILLVVLVIPLEGMPLAVLDILLVDTQVDKQLIHLLLFQLEDIQLLLIQLAQSKPITDNKLPTLMCLEDHSMSNMDQDQELNMEDNQLNTEAKLQQLNT